MVTNTFDRIQLPEPGTRLSHMAERDLWREYTRHQTTIETLGTGQSDQDTIQALQKRCADIKAAVAENYLHSSVKFYAHKFQNTHLDIIYEDALASAQWYFFRALRTFHPAKGCLLSTHIHSHIRHGLNRDTFKARTQAHVPANWLVNWLNEKLPELERRVSVTGQARTTTEIIEAATKEFLRFAKITYPATKYNPDDVHTDIAYYIEALKEAKAPLQRSDESIQNNVNLVDILDSQTPTPEDIVSEKMDYADMPEKFRRDWKVEFGRSSYTRPRNVDIFCTLKMSDETGDPAHVKKLIECCQTTHQNIYLIGKKMKVSAKKYLPRFVVQGNYHKDEDFMSKLKSYAGAEFNALQDEINIRASLTTQFEKIFTAALEDAETNSPAWKADLPALHMAA